MEPLTLIALAHMMAQLGVTDPTAIETRMNPAQAQAVQAQLDDGATLPEAVENVVAETQMKVDQGDIQIHLMGGKPTTVC